MQNADYFTLYIQPTYITVVPQYCDNRRNRVNAGHFISGITVSNDHQGRMSKKAQQRLKNSINWLVLAAPKKWVYQKETGKRFQFRVNLITLTLPTPEQHHSDTFIKAQLLHPWFQAVKYSHGLKNYVWKAETTAKGVIHFHVTTDTFIHWKDVRRTWNRQLERHGYIDKFEEKHHHRDPNSTDVHAVKKVKDLGAYLCKYLAKEQEGRREVKGKLWGTSYNLSQRNKLTMESFDLSRADISQLSEHKDISTMQKDHFTIHYFKPSIWGKLKQSNLSQHFRDHVASIRHDWQQSPPLITYTV